MLHKFLLAAANRAQEAPTDLVAANLPAIGSARLNWTNANSYKTRIERRNITASESNYTALDDVNVGIATYDDIGPASDAGILWGYVVRHIQGAVTGPISNEAILIKALPAFPDFIVSPSLDQIGLSWTNTYAIFSIYVTVDPLTEGASPSVITTLPPATTNYIVSPLLAGDYAVSLRYTKNSYYGAATNKQASVGPEI